MRTDVEPTHTIAAQRSSASDPSDVATLSSADGRESPELPPREEWPSSGGSLKKAPKRGLFDPAIVRPALVDSLRKLDPRHLSRNPVMLIVEIGAAITTVIFGRNLLGVGTDPTWFVGSITAWLWFTVIFANFAEAMAE